MDVKVHLLKQHASPAGNYPPRADYRVSKAEADALVDAGAAERVAEMRPLREAGPKAKKETATDKKAETTDCYREMNLYGTLDAMKSGHRRHFDGSDGVYLSHLEGEVVGSICIAVGRFRGEGSVFRWALWSAGVYR